jgi:peptide deformylase
VVDTAWTEEGAEREPTVLVNPEIVERDGKLVWTEGCLSVPDFTAEVERSERVVLRALDLDGKERIEEARGLRAVCFQHELDHLDGLLFIDRISRLKRNLYVQKRKKALRDGGGAWHSSGERPPLLPDDRL